MAFQNAPPLPPWIARHLPFERRTYVLERGEDRGRRLHLIDHGPRGARPVVLLHGNPTWSFLWRKVIRRLGGFRAVAPDLLGLGLSDRLKPGEHTCDRHAEALAELIDALELESFVMVGQDWGGALAPVVADRLGGKVAALVLGNTAVILPRRLKGTLFHRFARLPVLSDLAFRGLGFPQNALHRAQGDPRSIRGEVAQAYRWPLDSWSKRAAPLALARMVPDGPEHPSVEALRRGEAWTLAFDGPIALVWGERDPILGRALRRHQRALPEASVVRTPAGHFLQEEVPEALAQAIRAVAARA